MKKTLFLSLFLAWVNGAEAQKLYLEALSRYYNPALKPFYHGVASGDPTPHSVMIWTKITLDAEQPTSVRWELASDSLFSNVLKNGEAPTDASRNGTVLVDVDGLAPNTYYFYRFSHGAATSTTGRTKTAPTGQPKQVKMAVVSCSNFEAGYFNAYALLARRDDIDVVLHLGDYIYEYKTGGFGNKKLARKNIPQTEIVALDDYRARYSLYRLDPDLQLVHARHPFITIWDDHEIANDAYTEGAQNHQPDEEGDWETRKNAARQAYFEWLPVRRGPSENLYRQFSFGDLADLWMLDGRLEGRTKQAKSANDPDFAADSRRMLGEQQLQWLTQGMKQSTATWRVIGNQVFLSSVDASKVFKQNPKFMDMWDGYPAARNRLFDFFETNNMKNIVVVTGDSHTSWAFDLVKNPHTRATYDPKTGKGVVGVEFCAPSITSANYDEYVARWKAKIASRRFSKGGINPHVRYRDLVHHGYVLLTLTPATATAEWYHVKRILKPTRREKRAAKRTYSPQNRGM
ncbi:MAG: alkaline phosphatase D family protein [Saprospiraceae bacterium]|nr:alkaline phosphatase D family protein [Saprospiraceae bacterium]